LLSLKKKCEATKYQIKKRPKTGKETKKTDPTGAHHEGKERKRISSFLHLEKSKTIRIH